MAVDMASAGGYRRTCSWEMKTREAPSGEKRASIADCRGGSNTTSVRGAGTDAASPAGCAAVAGVGAAHSTRPQVRLKQYTSPRRNLRCGNTAC